ncbi:MAG: hypothetical protein MUD01_17200 [Chloroflexaceae bacterium]|jgi:hypothetical protein|nr:hypothetical protein [Chloroflexaceae bacterium]
MGETAVSMILFSTPTISLDDAARVLAADGLTVTREANKLKVHWRGGLMLTVALARAEWVVSESVEIGEGTAYLADLTHCDARFEILISNLDVALDEMNTLIQVQTALQNLTHGFLFNSWNGALQPPES